MQNRFNFLEDQFPKLAAYANNAEEYFERDKNICLLNLGRMAESIIELICKYYNINYDSSDKNIVQELVAHKIINDDIALEISTLTEIKHDAAENEYASEMSAQRLLSTAEDLCRWFVEEYGTSKFDFLADLFPSSGSVPPLANLAQYGSEAEKNLYTNTRYCLICLGDIEEALADMLFSRNKIPLPDKDQSDRINILFGRKIIDKIKRDTLHLLRMARNKAVHNRYDSEAYAQKLLNDALPLCEWAFRLIISTGDFVRGRIDSINEDNISVRLGRIHAEVQREEIPLVYSDKISDCYSEGERRVFKVVEVDGEKINLSINQVHTDPWVNAARRYAKYSVGQDVNATVKRLTEYFGVFVDLKDGLEARIPESEYGRHNLRPGDEVKARIKWFNSNQYPYMLLSVKDIEDGEQASKDEQQPPKKAISDKNFLDLCKNGTASEISDAINDGADPNAINNNKATPLIIAAMYNRDPEVIRVLLDAGAEINAQNHNGNTALMFAVMFNTYEVTRALLDSGADTEILNAERKKALHYAKIKGNKKLRNTDIIAILSGENLDTQPGIIPVDENEPLQEITTTPEKISDDEFLELCKSGTEQEIISALNAGANINARDEYNNTAIILALEAENVAVLNALLDEDIDFDSQNNKGNNALLTAAGTCTPEIIDALIQRTSDINTTNMRGDTALMIAAGVNSTEVVRQLIDAGADVNAKNVTGSTALIIAAAFNDAEVMTLLIRSGADINAKNFQEKRAVDIARKRTKFHGTNVLKYLLQRDFLRLCKFGTPEEIQQAVDEGVNVNAKNKSGSSALMFAAGSNSAEVVSLLLDAGADVNHVNSSGHRAIDFARANEKLNGTDIISRLG